MSLDELTEVLPGPPVQEVSVPADTPLYTAEQVQAAVEAAIASLPSN